MNQNPRLKRHKLKAWHGTYLVLLGALLQMAMQAAQAQTNPWADATYAPAPVTPPPIPRPSTPSPYTGHTRDGTLFMGGQRIGNPHQILHDIQNQSLFDVQVTRLTDTTDPAFGQGSLAQMETHMLQLLPTQSNELLTRLYVSPVNPYPQTPIGAFDNFTHYDEVIANSAQASYQLTVANDNNLWAFKTLAAPNSQAMNILIKELPAHQNFIANSDPMGGAVGVKVNSNGDAAALQNYFATTKPYDFSWRSAMGAWADGTARPNNVSAGLGAYANASIGNNEAGAIFFNWVMGSDQVQQYNNNLQAQSKSTGNEAFGVLAWDSNKNQYAMLDPTNVTATQESVSGTMPTLGTGQTAFFGMHTHPGDSTPSNQDLVQTNKSGLDQVVIGSTDASAIFTNSPSNNWQGSNFRFEGAREDSVSGAGYGSSAGAHDATGVGGMASGTGGQVGGNSGNRATTAQAQNSTARPGYGGQYGYGRPDSFLGNPLFDVWGFAVIRRLFYPEYRIPMSTQDKVDALLLTASAFSPALANYGGLLVSWGTNPNDPNHATRHLTASGVDVDATKAAITADLEARNVAGSPSGGLGIGTVTVDGVEVSYSAYKRPDGSVNVGSIRPSRVR